MQTDAPTEGAAAKRPADEAAAAAPAKRRIVLGEPTPLSAGASVPSTSTTRPDADDSPNSPTAPAPEEGEGEGDNDDNESNDAEEDDEARQASLKRLSDDEKARASWLSLNTWASIGDT
eukprot:7380314-Prymnesium_polylepis.1